MRKLLPYFFGVTTLVWLVGGTVWYRKNYCDVQVTVQPSAPTVSIHEGTQTVALQTPIAFTFADARPLFLTESIISLKKTVDELSDNRYKSLIIKGFYASKEKKVTPNFDLGLKRAESIKSILKTLGAPEDCIQLQSLRSENLSFINNQLQDGVEFSFAENPNKGFEGLNLYFSHKKFRFKETEDLEKYFNNLKNFMKANPDVIIDIKANALNTEGAKISEKRINYLKDFLKDKSINIEKCAFKTEFVALKSDKSKHKSIEIRRSDL
jgi:outer membrane protein OmpA-like peptidoglycan-associated protein